MKLIIDIGDKDKKICEQYVNGKLGDELGDYINITELADAIADGTPYEPESEWIPVSERMPEPCVAVMVYCPEYKNQYCAFYEDKHWQVFGAYDTVWDEVTHWKPLSHNPYESEKGGAE